MRTLILGLGMLAALAGTLAGPLPSQAQHGPSQAGIDRLLLDLERDFGVTAAFPAEWQAQNGGEVQQLYEGLHTVYSGFQQVAYRLWQLDGSPDHLTPAAHFRLHFDQANISLDRTFRLGRFEGNTAPRYEGGQVVGYMIQLAPGGLSRPFILAHEIGHVLDSLLGDQPQRDHVAELGGVAGTTGWIPGRGYQGNEILFPRAVAGPNEDFADTFGQMMMGRLSLLNSTAPRWLFMVRYTPRWLTDLRQRAAESADN